MNKNNIKFNIELGLSNLFRTKILDIGIVISLFFGILFLFIVIGMSNFEKNNDANKYKVEEDNKLIVEFSDINLSFRNIFTKDFEVIKEKFENVSLDYHQVTLKNTPITMPDGKIVYVNIVSSDKEQSHIHNYKKLKNDVNKVADDGKNICYVGKNISKKYFNNKIIGETINIDNNSFEIVGTVSDYFPDTILIPYEIGDKLNPYNIFAEKKINMVSFQFEGENYSQSKDELVKYIRSNKEFVKRGYVYEIYNYMLEDKIVEYKLTNRRALFLIGLAVTLFTIVCVSALVNGKIEEFEQDYIAKKRFSSTAYDILAQIMSELIVYGGISSALALVIFLVLLLFRDLYIYNILFGVNIIVAGIILPIVMCLALSLTSIIIVKSIYDLNSQEKVNKL